MVCSSCGKQRAELHPRKSRLMKGMTLYLCNDCDREKMEPRFVIILVGRSGETEKIVPYIKNHRYHGEPILAKELHG